MLIYTAEVSKNSKCLNLEITTSNILKLESLISTIKTINSKQKKTQFDTFTTYDFENEDLEAYYITVIKYLIRSLEPSVLNTFYNAAQNDFSILNTLLQYSHHPDVMIRNAARISLMTFSQNCTGDAMEYIISTVIPQHITDIIEHLKQYTLDIQHFYEKFNGTELERKYLCYKDELEYIDDILSLDFHINKLVIFKLFNEFILPFILTSISYEQNMEHSFPLSCRVGLYLLSKLLKTMTNTKLKDYAVSFFLLHETQIDANIDNKSIKQITKSLLFSLHKYKFGIDKLYTLQILNVFQYHISGNSMKCLKFFHEFLNTLMKTAMQCNFISNHFLEYVRLKLLTAIIEPLANKSIIVNNKWLYLRGYLSQTLEIFYNDICMKIRLKISDLETLIDDEYETFSNLKIDSDRILEDVNYLLQGDDYKNYSVVHDTKLVLWNLFFVRNLDLKLKNEKENILPILKRKEEIGNTLRIDNNSIPCEKLTHDNHYKNKHFFKFTDRQLLILQSTQDQSQGLVIFNSYYKDIFWSIDVNNIIKLYEIRKSNKFQFKNPSFSIQLKLDNSYDLHIIQNILLKSKSRQDKIMKNKLKNLLRHQDLNEI